MVYNDGQNDLIPIDELIANNITFYGETGYEIVQSIFDWSPTKGAYVVYENEKVFLENRIVNINKATRMFNTKFLKLKETYFTAQKFTFYYPIEITNCAYPSVEEVEPIKIRGMGFTSGITRG